MLFLLLSLSLALRLDILRIQLLEIDLKIMASLHWSLSIDNDCDTTVYFTFFYIPLDLSAGRIFPRILPIFFLFVKTKKMRTALFMFVIDVLHALFSCRSETFCCPYTISTCIHFFFGCSTKIEATKRNRYDPLCKMEIE